MAQGHRRFKPRVVRKLQSVTSIGSHTEVSARVAHPKLRHTQSLTNLACVHFKAMLIIPGRIIMLVRKLLIAVCLPAYCRDELCCSHGPVAGGAARKRLSNSGDHTASPDFLSVKAKVSAVAKDASGNPSTTSRLFGSQFVRLAKAGEDGTVFILCSGE